MSDSDKKLRADALSRSDTIGPRNKSQINKEYFQALEQWLNNVQSNIYSCSLVTGVCYPVNNRFQSSSFSMPNFNIINSVSSASPPNQFPRLHQQHISEVHGVEYKIPPLWKRFTAEFVDFMLLFLIKLAMAFIAADFFDFVDLDDIYIFQKKHMETDYKLAIEMTSGIIFLEMIHRLIVCIYEGIFLHKGNQNQIGGSTPGKSLMGIKVVFCYDVQQVGNTRNAVKVYPATNMGLGWSFARAFLKNLVLAVLFPIVFPLFFHKFHRTGYDILCNSIVVEDRSD